MCPIARTLSIISLAGALLMPGGPSMACGKNEYRGAFGVCYPKFRGTVGQLSEGVKKGDINAVGKSLGDIAIASSCPPCAAAGKALLSKNDQALVTTVVGRGLLLTAVGVPPTLVLFDASNTAKAVKLGQKQGAIKVPPAATRQKKHFKSLTQATCLVLSADGKLTAGWITAPSLEDASTGKAGVFPKIDLRAGDLVTINSAECPATAVAQGGTPITHGTLVYEEDDTVPGEAEQMQFFIWGPKAK